MLAHHDSIMANAPSGSHPLLSRRQARGWTQAELARRADISRAAVSAIELGVLTPSVAAALALARTLECSVEELFGGGHSQVVSRESVTWAWEPRAASTRYWEAEVGGHRRLFPVEALTLNPTRHDGVTDRGLAATAPEGDADRTLVLACCDPAAGLLATEYARETGFRLLVFPRGSSAALELLKRGVVHVAGLHRSTADHPERNGEAVRAHLGEGFRLLRLAEWEEGIVLPASDGARSAESLTRRPRRWAAREPGSAARECLDELLGRRRFDGREVDSHAAVAEAVHAGWAEAGVCVRLCAEEAGLKFLSLRQESLDLCFATEHQSDPRIQALIRLLRSRRYRRLLSELPGYDARHTGDAGTI